MKNEPLTGYLLHARPYQEKRAIYRFFSAEHGVVHGVGGRGMPSFVLMECFATGSNSLKNFSQICPKSTPTTHHFGQIQFTLLYLNELIYKLIAPENPCPTLWQSYHHSILALQQHPSMPTTKQILREFESCLFAELGASIDWQVDNLGQAIDPVAHYNFVPNQGFIKTSIGTKGEKILNPDLVLLGRIHRQLVDCLLDYQPLNSRKLWAEQLKYR